MPTYESLPAKSTFFNGNLFQKMVDDLRLAGMAKRAVYGYLQAVRKLADFCQKSPDQIDEQDVRRYLLHLIVELEVATGPQTVALSGIKFFFRYRVALSDNRIQAVDDQGVTYQVKPSGKSHCVRWQAGDGQFMRSFVQHILPRGFQKVRYYGWMSPNCKLQLADVRWLVWLWRGLTYWLGNAMFQAEPRKAPISSCGRCRGELELISISNLFGKTIWQRQPTSGLQSPAASLPV